MSDFSQVFIRLDVPTEEERSLVVDSVRTWLLSTEVIEPFAPKPTWREEFGTSDFSPGPRWRDVVDEVPGAPFETLWHNGVDIRSTVDDRSALSNTDGDDLAGEWVDTQEEPSVQCQRVGGLLPLATGGATLPRFSSAHPSWSSTTGTR